MKKLIFFLLIAFSVNGAYIANANQGKPNYKYSKTYYKGNIAPEDLPEVIIEYLDENYPDYTIMVSKIKNNGNYFVKIRYAGNKYRSYYRSLVFNHKGGVIKG